jgi:nicotinamide-nucleotide amidase
MIAEILATGDEIRTGALVDSNSAFVADLLQQHGIVVQRHHCVGDELHDLIAVIREISDRRPEVVVVTGGLGPTVDDRTIEAAAKVAGVKMILDKKALSDIELFFKKRNRPFSETNRKQAMIPQGASFLYNPIGTAPGVCFRIKDSLFFFLPGVPIEMKLMLNEQVLPRISTLQDGNRQYCLLRTISTFGLPESVVGEKVAGVSEKFPQVILGLRAKFPEIQVKLYLQTYDKNLGQATLDAAANWISEKLGRYIFSQKGRTIAEEVGQILLERKETLALAESCTGGLVANWITNTAGSSQYFLFSAVTYHNDAKIDVLGVSANTLQMRGAVDEETAQQMAEGARRVGRSTYGLAITGIAGPNGGSEEKPVGTVCIALASYDKIISRQFNLSFGQRLMNKRMFAMTALDMLRKHLQHKDV